MFLLERTQPTAEAARQSGSPRLYEAVLDGIKEMISTGQIAPNQRLPSERDLASQFHVSRVPVREAIKILEYMNIVENRQGAGMYLRSNSITDSFMGDVHFSDQLTEDVILDLFEMRIILEGKACYYAAQRRTREDLAAIRTSIDDMRSALEKTPQLPGEERDAAMDAARILSHAFHSRVVAAAHNVVLDKTYHSLLDLLAVSKQLTIADMDRPHSNVFTHEYILSRIVERDCAGAERAMVEHLEDARDYAARVFREKQEQG